MKHLTDELDSRWAVIECLMDGAAQHDRPLLARCELLARAADQLDAVVTALHTLKPDKARKARMKAAKTVQKMEQLATGKLFPQLEKKNVRLSAWTKLSEKKRMEAEAQGIALSFHAGASQPVTPEALAMLPSGTLLMVSGSSIQDDWHMYTLTPGAARLLHQDSGKDHLMIPVETACPDMPDTTWSCFRILRRQNDGDHPRACMLECAADVQEDAVDSVRRMLGLLPEFVRRPQTFCGLGNLLHAIAAWSDAPEKLQWPEQKARSCDELKRETLFASLEKQDWLLLHPYDKVKPLWWLMKRAAESEQVTELKLIEDRLPEGDRITAMLCQAAELGCTVTVVLDQHDAVNQASAARLTAAGCKVLQPAVTGAGVHLLQLRCKREDDEDQVVIRLSTSGCTDAALTKQTNGSYLHAAASSDPVIQDIERLYEWLMGGREEPECELLTVSPLGMRQELLRLIRREMQCARMKKASGIQAVLPELTDPVLIDALYDASRIGVPVTLYVEGPCRLQPGLPGISERISVEAVHQRHRMGMALIQLENAGKPETYLSTCGWTQDALSRENHLLWCAAKDKDAAGRFFAELTAGDDDRWILQVDDYTALRC